jgi:hypothetical protein
MNYIFENTPKSLTLLNKRYYSNNAQYDFWKNGFLKINIEGPEKNNLLDRLQEIYKKRDMFNFIKKEKYNNSEQLDLRESDEFYDFAVLFLKEFKILKKINFITCKNLQLSNLTIRINCNAKKNDGFWGEHRDTAYVKNKTIKGNVPPLTHLIYYPNLNNFPKVEKQLRLWKMSHRRMYSGILEKLSKIFCKKEDIFTNNDQMLLFDGSIIHAVGYTSNPRGNLRLIFSFLDQHQIYDGIEHYEKINRWKKIINS